MFQTNVGRHSDHSQTAMTKGDMKRSAVTIWSQLRASANRIASFTGMA
jgi:hypothetical protein